jgi:hypothetical protein
MEQASDMINRVVVYASDPWDFVTDNGSGPFLADVLPINRGERPPSDPFWLLRLGQPLRNEHGAFTFLLAATRLAGYRLDDISGGVIVPTNFAFVSAEQATSEQQFDTSTTPPFGFFIGDLRAAKQG